MWSKIRGGNVKMRILSGFNGRDKFKDIIVYGFSPVLWRSMKEWKGRFPYSDMVG